MTTPSEDLRTGSSPTAVLVISAHPELRRDAAGCFEKFKPGNWAWQQAESLAQGSDLALAKHPRIVLLDFTADCLEVQQWVRRLKPRLPASAIVGLYNPLQLPPQTDRSEFLLEGVRSGVFDFLRLPLSPEEVRNAVERLERSEKASPKVAGEGRVVSFISGKGGVGKTTMVVNMGTLLAQKFPGEVAIIDTSMDLGNVCDYLNISSNQSLYDAVVARKRLDRDLLVSLMTRHEDTGLLVLGGPRLLEQMTAINDSAIAQLLLSARSAFRYVLVDTLPMFNAVSIAVGDTSDAIVVVTEAIVPAINGTRELLKRLEGVGYPPERIRVLLNKYGTRSDENVEANLVSEALGRSLDWIVPYDRRMHVCANIGRPFISSCPTSPTGRKIMRLTSELAGQELEQKISPLGRLLALFR